MTKHYTQLVDLDIDLLISLDGRCANGIRIENGAVGGHAWVLDVPTAKVVARDILTACERAIALVNPEAQP